MNGAGEEEIKEMRAKWMEQDKEIGLKNYRRTYDRSKALKKEVARELPRFRTE